MNNTLVQHLTTNRFKEIRAYNFHSIPILLLEKNLFTINAISTLFQNAKVDFRYSKFSHDIDTATGITHAETKRISTLGFEIQD